MKMKKKAIAIIPPRGKSKRIPGKNFRKFNGKIILASTIIKLKKSKLFDKIIVSTDSKKISSIAKKNGAEVPFIRPKSLSGDKVSTAKTIQHAIKFLINRKDVFNYICCVYAPNPFLKVSDLKKGFNTLKSKKCDFVFSATPYQFPFFRSFTFSEKKGVKLLFRKNYFKRSQDLQQIFCDAGHFYWGYKEAWFKKIQFTKKSKLINIPKSRYHDIDTLEDWKRAETFSKFLK